MEIASYLVLLLGCIPTLCIGRGRSSRLGDIDTPGVATVTVVSTADQLMSAVESGNAHIRLVAHVDLRSFESSVPEAGVLLTPGVQLQSITGRCQAAAPVVHGEPPLGKLRHQQCLVQLSKGFLGWFAAAADGVWLDNLYIRSPVADDRISRSASPDKQHTILQWRPQQTAALWLSNVTTQGGSTSLFVSAASAYAEDLTLRDYNKGVQAWAGADVALLRGTWLSSTDMFGPVPLSVEADPEEMTRARLERCKVRRRYPAISLSPDAIIFIDTPGTLGSGFSVNMQPLEDTGWQINGAAEAEQLYYGYGYYDGFMPMDAYGYPAAAEAMGADAAPASNSSHADAGVDSDAHTLAVDRTGNASWPAAGNDSWLLAGRTRHGNRSSLARSQRYAQQREQRRKAQEKAALLRPRFLKATDRAFQDLQTVVAQGIYVEAPPAKAGRRGRRGSGQGGLWTSLANGGTEQTVMLLALVILLLVFALTSALGCIVGLCTARALPTRPRDWEDQRLRAAAREDAVSSAVVRGTGAAGDAAKQRRRRVADTEPGEEAVLLSHADSADNLK